MGEHCGHCGQRRHCGHSYDSWGVHCGHCEHCGLGDIVVALQMVMALMILRISRDRYSVDTVLGLMAWGVMAEWADQ